MRGTMLRQTSRLVLFGAVAVAVIVAGAAIAGEMGMVAIGSPMPDVTMTAVDGTTHTLSQYKGQIAVLNFCSQECPYSRGADVRWNQLIKDYSDKGVVFLGIDSHSETQPEAIKEYAGKMDLAYTILKDEQNRYADTVGAKKTPEIYIVDKDGNLAYHGGFDNQGGAALDPSLDAAAREEIMGLMHKEGYQNFVGAALNNLLAGQAVEKPETSAWGCTIKRAAKMEGSMRKDS